jgi:hypothetical protein
MNEKCSTLYITKNIFKKTAVSCRKQALVISQLNRYSNAMLECVKYIGVSLWYYENNRPNCCSYTHCTPHTTNKKATFTNKWKSTAFIFLKIARPEVTSSQNSFLLHDVSRRFRETQLYFEVSPIHRQFCLVFSSVYTCSVFVFSPYRMAINSEFTRKFVVGSVFSKCILGKHDIPVVFPLYWMWRITHYKILLREHQCNRLPESANFDSKIKLTGSYQKIYSRSTKDPMVSSIFKLDTRKMWAFTFTLRPLYTWWKFRYLLDVRLPKHNMYGCRGKREKSMNYSGNRIPIA